jgi:hypothetical protein
MSVVLFLITNELQSANADQQRVAVLPCSAYLVTRRTHNFGHGELLIDSWESNAASSNQLASWGLDGLRKPLSIIAARKGANRGGGEQSIGSEAGMLAHLGSGGAEMDELHPCQALY